MTFIYELVRVVSHTPSHIDAKPTPIAEFAAEFLSAENPPKKNTDILIIK